MSPILVVFQKRKRLNKIGKIDTLKKGQEMVVSLRIKWSYKTGLLVGWTGISKAFERQYASTIIDTHNQVLSYSSYSSMV